jgi:soluble lytic murein transglycosylase
MPSAVSVRSRRDAARRTSMRRRRRILGTFAALALIGVLVSVLTPAFRKAVSEFTLPLAYSDIIRQQAAEKHLDPELIAAVIYAETKFDSRSSAAGAEGLMQIMPRTAEFLAHRSGATTFMTADLAMPEVNIAYGSYYLRYLLDQFDGNKILALAAYNGGVANVVHWLARARADGRTLTVEDIPFSETRNYVQKVLAAELDYRRTYPSQLGYR